MSIGTKYKFLESKKQSKVLKKNSKAELQDDLPPCIPSSSINAIPAPQIAPIDQSGHIFADSIEDYGFRQQQEQLQQQQVSQEIDAGVTGIDLDFFKNDYEYDDDVQKYQNQHQDDFNFLNEAFSEKNQDQDQVSQDQLNSHSLQLQQPKFSNLSFNLLKTPQKSAQNEAENPNFELEMEGNENENHTRFLDFNSSLESNQGSSCYKDFDFDFEGNQQEEEQQQQKENQQEMQQIEEEEEEEKKKYQNTEENSVRNEDQYSTDIEEGPEILFEQPDFSSIEGQKQRNEQDETQNCGSKVPLWKVTQSIQKRKKQNDYEKNICRYIARCMVRCFVNFSYKKKVLSVIEKVLQEADDKYVQQLREKQDIDISDLMLNISDHSEQQQQEDLEETLYVSCREYMLGQLESLTGHRALQDTLSYNNEGLMLEKQVFRRFSQWFLKERAFRYIMSGNMRDKQSYLRYKNKVMLKFINKPESWTSNIVRVRKK